MPVTVDNMETLFDLAAKVSGDSHDREATLQNLRQARASVEAEANLQNLAAAAVSATEDIARFGSISKGNVETLTSRLRDCVGSSRPGACTALDELAARLSQAVFVDAVAHEAADLAEQATAMASMEKWLGDVMVGDVIVPFSKCLALVNRINSVAKSSATVDALITAGGSIADDLTTELLVGIGAADQEAKERGLGEGGLRLHVVVTSTAKEVSDRLKATQLKDAEEAVKAAHEELKPRATGTGDAGQTWHEGLSADATFATVMTKVAATIFKQTAKDVSAAATKCKDACQRYVRLQELHGTPLPGDNYPPWLEEAAECCRVASSTLIVGVLATQLKANRTSPLTLKKMSRNQQKLAVAPFLGKSCQRHIPPSIRATAVQAEHMQFVWPDGL